MFFSRFQVILDRFFLLAFFEMCIAEKTEGKRAQVHVVSVEIFERLDGLVEFAGAEVANAEVITRHVTGLRHAVFVDDLGKTQRIAAAVDREVERILREVHFRFVHGGSGLFVVRLHVKIFPAEINTHEEYNAADNQQEAFTILLDIMLRLIECAFDVDNRLLFRFFRHDGYAIIGAAFFVPEMQEPADKPQK